jgi:hypothetical protein
MKMTVADSRKTNECVLFMRRDAVIIELYYIIIILLALKYKTPYSRNYTAYTTSPLVPTLPAPTQPRNI